jgi:hypothetical protein
MRLWTPRPWTLRLWAQATCCYRWSAGACAAKRLKRTTLQVVAVVSVEGGLVMDVGGRRDLFLCRWV